MKEKEEKKEGRKEGPKGGRREYDRQGCDDQCLFLLSVFSLDCNTGVTRSRQRRFPQSAEAIWVSFLFFRTLMRAVRL